MADRSTELAPPRRLPQAVVTRAPSTRVLAAPWLWVGLVVAVALLASVRYVVGFSQDVVMP